MGERLSYDAAGQTMLGYRARPERPNGAAILVLPAFAGLRAFEMARCDAFAALGYEVLGVDYHGNGWVAGSAEEAFAAMAALNDDRSLLLSRITAALHLAQGWADKVGTVGFCLGGKAALDLARAGLGDAAVVLHGVYDAPGWDPVPMPPVLLCHGWLDPLAPPADFVAVSAELEANCADWHALCFGGTSHAFTNPAHVGDADGMVYVERSTRRSWAAAEAFLAEQLIGP